MTIQIPFEKDGLRISADIHTLNVEAHSALTEVPKEEIEQVRIMISQELRYLMEAMVQHRKDIG